MTKNEARDLLRSLSESVDDEKLQRLLRTLADATNDPTLLEGVKSKEDALQRVALTVYKHPHLKRHLSILAETGDVASFDWISTIGKIGKALFGDDDDENPPAGGYTPVPPYPPPPSQPEIPTWVWIAGFALFFLFIAVLAIAVVSK